MAAAVSLQQAWNRLARKSKSFGRLIHMAMGTSTNGGVNLVGSSCGVRYGKREERMCIWMNRGIVFSRNYTGSNILCFSSSRIGPPSSEVPLISGIWWWITRLIESLPFSSTQTQLHTNYFELEHCRLSPSCLSPISILWLMCMHAYEQNPISIRLPMTSSTNCLKL